MGLWTDFIVAYNSKRDEQRAKAEPRPLTEQDRVSWYSAQDRRTSNLRDMDAVKALIRQRNPIRWRCLRKDFAWMQKEMKRLGLNPEDARYLL